MSRYTRQGVEALLPAVWDEQAAYGLQNPYAAAPDMPKATSNKAAANTLYAMLADIRTAWVCADLTLEQRQALFLRFGLDWEHGAIAAVQQSPRTTTTSRIEAGIGRLTAWLNGDACPDGEEGERATWKRSAPSWGSLPGSARPRTPSSTTTPSRRG